MAENDEISINGKDVFEGTTLKIFNYHSSIDNFYSLKSSYQVTCESCDGLAAGCYVDYSMISPNEKQFSHIPAEEYFANYNARALHHHNFYEFMLVLEGEVIHKIENAEYAYSAGTCCLINKNIRHTEKYIGAAKVMFLDLTLPFIEELLQGCQKESFREERPVLAGNVFEFIRADMPLHAAKSYLDFYPTASNQESARQLNAMAEDLLSAIAHPFFGSNLVAKGLICRIIGFLSSPVRYHATPVTMDSRADYLLFSHVSHLLEDRRGIITRRELEESFHYSASYINSIIKKYSGMNLYDYRMTFCMLYAARQLVSTDEPIGEIMQQLSFSNPTHFYNVFKKAYGATPLQYRKKHKGSPA